MALQAGDIGDLIKTTLPELGEMKFTDLTTDTQQHVAFNELIRKGRQSFDAGPYIQWDIMTDHNDSAEFVGLWEVDQVDAPDVMVQATHPWRHLKASWAVEHREVSMNRSPRKIVDLLKTRRLAGLVSLAEKVETRFWRTPATTDTTNPHGIPYWVVKNNSEGFNGALPGSHTTVAGLSTTTYPRWKNYTAQYTAITKDDLIRKWREASKKTFFKAPVNVDMPTFNTGDSYGYYTTHDVQASLVEILESQNENLGGDVAPYDGSDPMFRRRPVTWVPALDDDTTGPIYGLNWGELKVIALRGEWMRETVIDKMPGQHNVTATFIDCTLNVVCRNRRRNFVLATNTTMPA